MSRSRKNRKIISAGIDLISRGLIKELNDCLLTSSHAKRRRWWVKPWISGRETHGASSTLLKEWDCENPDDYRNYLRMNEDQFEYLLDKVTPFIKKKDTLLRESHSPKIKLHMVLRYLATVDTIGTLSALYRVPRSTFSMFLPEVCEAVYNALEDFIRVPDTVESWEKVMRDYETLWNFPNVCGAIHGKHVNIKRPRSAREYQMYAAHDINSKKGFSKISLFAIVDANYNFLYIDVGTNGRANDDASVFAKSTFNVALQNNVINLPEQAIFVADNAFPLRTDILKPFSRCAPLNETQKIFNYRLSRARRVVENTFGILVSKFQIYEKPIPLCINTTEQVVKSTCALHNWLKKTSTSTHPYIQTDMLDVEDWDEGRVIQGTATQTPHGGLEDIPRTTVTNHTKAARELREHYAERFVTTDIVPWQWKMI